MKHYLDICNLDGREIEPVDIITFGSPCQDLSVAGRRAGLKHEDNGDGETTRSGLFMEAIRIIKEMREATDGRYPTFAFWENVPGAFSSNKGEDFRIVLEELIKIAEPEAPPLPPAGKNGWAYADCIVGDGWSIAYRVLDAQYWGVPQRRRRIALIADFAGERAGEILFERESLSRNSETCGTQREAASANAERSVGTDDCTRNCLTPWDYQGKRVYSADGVFPTLYSAENSGQQQQAVCLLVMETPENCKYKADGYCKKIRGDSLPFLPYCVPYTQPCALEAAGFKAGQSMAGGIGWQEACATTLAAQCSGTEPTVCVKCYDARGNGDGQTVSTLTGDHENRITDYTSVVCMAQGQAKPNGGQSLNFSGAVRIQYIVRRLTPTECARLQGFPDCWGHIDHKDDFTDDEYRFWLDVRNTHASINGKTVKEYTKAQMLTWYNKLHTDSAEYKMWGNGVALPFVRFPISRMAALGAKTLGSLFDGSGGFPLAGVLEGITPLWASEIEPYPIAVTVSRFKCG